MTANLRVLEVPRRINAITDVQDHALTEDPYPPFFGFAPAETPVRMVNCPVCGTPVSAAHLHLHRASHQTLQEEPTRTSDHFHLQTDSPLAPLTKCAYAERQEYTFKMLFERDGNR